MRTRAVDDQHLVLLILGHPGGRHLAVRDVDRTLHMAFRECAWPAPSFHPWFPKYNAKYWKEYQEIVGIVSVVIAHSPRLHPLLDYCSSPIKHLRKLRYHVFAESPALSNSAGEAWP